MNSLGQTTANLQDGQVYSPSYLQLSSSRYIGTDFKTDFDRECSSTLSESLYVAPPPTTSLILDLFIV